MSREILKKYRKEMDKKIKEEKIIANTNIPAFKKEEEKQQYNTIDDVIGIMFDENIKSKNVRQIKAKKELMFYLENKYSEK